MQTLLKAIADKFTSAGLGTTIIGGLHFQLAPAGPTLPFAVYRLAASPTTEGYVGTGYTEPQIDFIVEAVDANTSLGLCESLRDTYKDVILTLSSGQMINSVLVFDPVPSPDDPTQDEQGRDSFGFVCSFRFSIR